MKVTRLFIFLAWWGGVGASIPVIAFLISLALPLFPTALLLVVLAVCPPYLLFLATAACAPLDWCSLSTLGLAIFLNASLYILVGTVAWFLRRAASPSRQGRAS